ncbi:MAG TPA: hypothetical protein VGO78_19625, partial [Acidimicrobiales bacterium]|nr:hypothetical protein [Acidimicrobiales bacterium]
THAYLAPECFDTGPVGPATDLWALGATLFHAAAGRPPFERDTTTATLRAILLEEPPPPPCGPPLATAITGLLTRAVDQRLTGNAARQLLQQAVSTMPTVQAPPTIDPGSQSAWQAQSTSLHRAPATPPPGPPNPPPAPPGPPGPPGPPPMSAPSYGMPPVGPPPQRNNTPLILGVLGAVAALVLVVVLASSGGSDSDGDDNGGSVAGQTSLGQDDPVPGANPTDPASPPAGADPAVADGQALAQQFLDLVNGGDADAAIAMLCPIDTDQDYAGNITEAAGDAALQIDPSTAELVSDGVVYAVDLTGSVHGDSVSSAHVSAAARDNCIVTFSAR